MKILNHLLYNAAGKQIKFVATPNKGGKYTPAYLIIHYTAATTAASSVNWFQKKEAKASAHLLIDRNGDIVQFAPFNIVTWHAGQSAWGNINGLNQHTIGIELVNGGRLTKAGTSWICPVDKKRIPDEEVTIARHKNEATETGWHEYTEKQLQVAIEVGALLAQQYGLKEVLGHDDISPYRKSDPGPVFPMGSYRSRVMGRKESFQDTYITTDSLNIRSGPGTAYTQLSKPLPKNTKVLLLKHEGNWSFVQVEKAIHGLMDLEGWVFSKYLSPLN